MNNSPLKLLLNRVYLVDEAKIKQINPDIPIGLYKTPSFLHKPTKPAKNDSLAESVSVAEIIATSASIDIKSIAKINQTNPAESIKKEVGSNWQELISQINSCNNCNLCNNRVNAVIEAGSRQGKWMFIGEDAGELENNSGKPFMGNSGELLAKMLLAMKLDINKDVYLTNIVKCIAPVNKNPTLENIHMCNSYLMKQIELVKPNIIIVFGKLASQGLLNSQIALNKLRLNHHQVLGVPVVVTYSLASLLRNPILKKDTWLDLQFAMQILAH